MIKKLLVISFIIALGAWASTAAAGPGHGADTQCYVWANNATSNIGAAYNPSSPYSFNTNGDAATKNMVTRTATGTYTVNCKGVGGGGWGAPGGHVQVTAYGNTNSACKVQNWGTGGADFTASVKCYGSTGAAVNSQFDLLFVW
ncbi:hypothetical protein [Crenothrix sp.]|uniref:hypothetical protein n=1 Tax=Crenothrix sp. TaxID=3100433 RepID=UPI00374DE788